MEHPLILTLDRTVEGDRHHLPLQERDPRQRGPSRSDWLAREIRITVHALRVRSHPGWQEDD